MNDCERMIYFGALYAGGVKGLKETVKCLPRNRTGAEVYEIKSNERTAGTLGFWWCGRFCRVGRFETGREEAYSCN